MVFNVESEAILAHSTVEAVVYIQREGDGAEVGGGWGGGWKARGQGGGNEQVGRGNRRGTTWDLWPCIAPPKSKAYIDGVEAQHRMGRQVEGREGRAMAIALLGRSDAATCRGGKHNSREDR